MDDLKLERLQDQVGATKLLLGLYRLEEWKAFAIALSAYRHRLVETVLANRECSLSDFHRMQGVKDTCDWILGHEQRAIHAKAALEHQIALHSQVVSQKGIPSRGGDIDLDSPDALNPFGSREVTDG